MGNVNGFPYPDPSDRVNQGAAAIEALARAVSGRFDATYHDIWQDPNQGFLAVITDLANIHQALTNPATWIHSWADPAATFNQTPEGLSLGNCNLLAGYGSMFTCKAYGAGVQLFVNYGVGDTNSPSWGLLGVRTWDPAGNGNWGPWRTFGR